MKILMTLFLLLPNLIFAQIISGKIIDEQNQPIKNSSVEVEIPSQDPIIIESNENGEFNFELHQAQSFIIYIKKFGYQEFEKRGSRNCNESNEFYVKI